MLHCCIPARKSGAERRDRATMQLSSIACTSARVRSLASPHRARPAAPRPQRQGGGRGRGMGAGDGGVGVAGPVNAAANQRAATNAAPSLALPVAIQLDSTAQAIPATTLRITCVLSWAVLAQFVHGERRPTARVVADWRVGPRRGCRQIKAWRASPRGLRRGGMGTGGRREGTGVRWEANVLQRADQQNRHRLVSPRLRWLLRPSCVSACLAPVLQCVRVPRVHQLLVTAIVPANMGQYSQRYRSI
jgi:hypothetical protein